MCELMWRTVPDISVVQKYNFCYWFQSGKKSEVAGWAVTSHVLNQGQRCGALGFPNILPQPLSVYKTSLRFQGSRDLLFGVKKPGAISGDVLSPGCSGSMVGWVMTRQSVRVTALGLLQTSLPAPVSPNTLCLPHTEECLSKPVPWKTELEGFSGPLPLIAQLCFSFCWFLSLFVSGWVLHIRATVRGAVSSQWANFPNSCRLWARVIMAAKANCVWVRLKPY